jgi:hypothetical protein
MVASRTDVTTSAEELLARLTATAYSVALRHGLKGPFIDVELALWRELRAVLAEELAPPSRRWTSRPAEGAVA